MTIIADLQSIIDEAEEEGYFCIDDLKDIVEKGEGEMKTLGELIKSAKKLITYDKEDEMWRLSLDTQPLAKMLELIVHIATLDEN